MQFQHLLQQAIARGLRSHSVVAMLYLDMDHFKEVNDTFGHAAGDRVLEVLTERLISVLVVDLPNYDWSYREGRFVGFSGVLAWGREDELTGRVLDDYEQMVSESGDYFETCGELTIAVDPSIIPNHIDVDVTHLTVGH